MRRDLLLSSLFTLLGVFANDALAQERLPIIDMHLDSYDETNYYVAPDRYGTMAPPTAEAHCARLSHGDPLLIEDVLVRYRKLKIYLMHAGEFYYENALRLMLSYPQVYAGLGVVLWVGDAPKHYGRQFLLPAKKFGMLDRVMFGSDQMVWPHAIDASIEELNSFDFLTNEEKRDILYNNAARFPGLSEEQIAGHHRR